LYICSVEVLVVEAGSACLLASDEGPGGAEFNVVSGTKGGVQPFLSEFTPFWSDEAAAAV
jgi:hypothetical protein